MKKYLQILSIITAGLVSLATIHTSVFAAEVVFQCGSVSSNSGSAYLVIDVTNGRVSGREIKITYVTTPRSTVSDQNLLRPLNAYQVWWSGGDPIPISFASKGNNTYEGTAVLNNYPISVANYEFKLQTSSGADLDGNCTTSVTVNGDQSYTFSQGTALRGMGCDQVVGFDEPVGFDLFTCNRNCGNGLASCVNIYPASITLGCGADNVDRSVVTCQNYLNSNPGVNLACISCPADNPLTEQAAAVSWGNICPTGAEGLPCYASRPVGDQMYDNVYTCRTSATGSLKCLATPFSRVLRDNRCAVGENECAARENGTFAALRCTGTDTIGVCTAGVVTSCNPGARILSKGSPCLATDYCFGAQDNNNGVCITESELTNLLADTDYLRRLGITPAQLRQARDEFGIEVVPETDIDTSVTSPAAGPCNCPGLRSLCVTNGNFNTDGLKTETATSIREKLGGSTFAGLNQDEKTNAVSCFTCVTQGNTWTDSFGCVNTTVSGLFTSVLRIALGVIGGIVLIRFIILGYQYAFSSQKMKLEEAVKNVLATLGALLLVLFSVVILRIIGVNILDVVPPGFFGS